MTKQSKSAIAFIISVAIMLSTFVFAGAVENDDLNAETVGTSDAWSRTVEFDKYEVVPSENSHKEYFSVIDDPDEEGDSLLHYYNSGASNSMTRYWAITPTPTGKTNTNSDPESGQVLPVNTKFKMTWRLRINDDCDGKPVMMMFYGTGTAYDCNHSTTKKTTDPAAFTDVDLKESTEWQEISVYFTTPEEYPILTNGEEQAVANRLYVGIRLSSQKLNYDLDYIKLEKVVPITYDANGGTFSDGSTTKTLNEVVGAKFTVDSPSYPGKGFYGWSLDTDGGEVLSKVEVAHSGNTLYAVWGAPGPHPADGVYSPWSRTIEFDKYEVVPGVNSHSTYFSVIDDPDEEGDSLLHYYNSKGSNSRTRYWAITPTPTGETNTNSDPESGQVLPLNSKFKMTWRLRINDDCDGKPTMRMFYGTGNACHEITTAPVAFTDVDLKESTEWQEISVYFTTPEEYTTLTNGEVEEVANRLYVGILLANNKLNYDLDYIKLEKVTTTNLYLKQDNEYVLWDSLEGVPGEALNLPAYYSEESYSLYDPTGSYTETYCSNWYSDEACTEAAVMKYGNYDVDLYCEPTAVPAKITENQDMFVGFDTYTQRTEGLKNAIITDEAYNTGSVSLKANVSPTAPALFELKNDHTLDVLNGKTYRIDFSYKADKNSYIDFGLANGIIDGGITSKCSIDLKAADDWTSASAIITADGALDNSVLAAKISSTVDATVLIDTIIVSSATESVGVEAETTDDGEALRFMLSYGGETVKMAGEDYTVTEHGVLVKGAELDTDLVLENADKAGIFAFSQTDMSKNWSVNPITGTTVYSAYLNGFDKSDDYKVSVRGYVMLDGTVYYSDILTASVADIPDAKDIIPENADLSDYYVYLPEGTTLPAERDYTVTTYNDLFVANNAEKNNVITVGSYVLFSARPDFDKIIVPSEQKFMVHAGTKDELYYGIDAQIVSEKISEVGSDTVNYLFITDIHYSDKAKEHLNNQAALMAKMANENDDIDFVVIGGDTTTGMFETKEDCIAATHTALDPFLDCTKPVFVLMGNHDDNSYHLQASSNPNHDLYEERVITDLDWQNYIINRYTNKGNIKVVQDDPAKRANSKYFYYDLEDKKTRVVCLDALDYEAKYDENGFVLGDINGDGLLDGMPVKNAEGETDIEKYHNGNTSFGYSADQVRWLAEDVLGDLPDDYEVVIVSHMGIDKTSNSNNTTIWFGENIREIIKTFNAGGTYTASLTDNWGNAVSVNADFSDKNGDIVSWQFGHQHVELSFYESDVDLWQLCTPSANVYNSTTDTYEELANSKINRKDLPWRVYTRKLGDKTEACFNVMSVSSERVYRFSVGQGNNEKLVYAE